MFSHLLFVVMVYFCAVMVQIRSEKKLVDLTHVFDDTTIYIGERLEITVTNNQSFPDKGIWLHTESFSTPTHGGTHMDAPCTFDIDAWCIGDIPPERFILPAVVIDISDKVGDNPGRHLLKEDVVEWEKQHGIIPNASLVLIRTGWSKYWNNFENYTGIDENGTVWMTKFPTIGFEASEYIMENRSIYGIGIDAYSLGLPYNSSNVHMVAMRHNVYGLENLDNLDLLPPTGATVYAMPMKLGSTSAAPCRVMAQLP